MTATNSGAPPVQCSVVFPQATVNLFDTYTDHLDGLDWVVVSSLHLTDLKYEVVILTNLAKDWMLRVTTTEPVEKGIVTNIYKELTASAVGVSCIGHTECPCEV